jgi:activator of 2-hydroxyglutaryl-CoA dehydratase/predicted nucleotide-binding protein (sugar kinase/HSP70/actin superfamily)
MSNRFIGIDVGAETVKVVELVEEGDRRVVGRRVLLEHGKDPAGTLLRALEGFDWGGATGAASTGRLGRMLDLERVPVKGAQTAGLGHLYPEIGPVTLVSIGGHGFSVLELREGGSSVFRENSRCSQGTGNFLRQLVERFDLTVEEASALCAGVEQPAPLSGRCPVILKTDMTHLANKGESKERILAGLYDAVCENVQVLVKPKLAPPRVLLAGGVSRAARIRDHFRRFLAANGMALWEPEGDDLLYVEAIGAASVAAERAYGRPALERLVLPRTDTTFEEIPGLGASMGRVRRLRHELPGLGGEGRRLLLGFDMGSTGSKVVALDVDAVAPVWQAYRNTNGDPVGAAQGLMRTFLDEGGDRHRVTAAGATGSGREIVGSLLASCYGGARVFVLNEIAAHAAGATYYDAAVDTIFEIGGQDAKYVRLSGGQVYDAAMNEACSAGTGSFIEEQGKKFADVRDVVQMASLAMEADHGISLGQHCSVFMAEIIDSATAAGRDRKAILAGIYDSIIQNYLNRVKGSRSVGERIFCQGMPFAADAPAAAVARQTGREVVVPPDPGTVGALGIGLLARKELPAEALADSLDPRRFLEAKVVKKDTFHCKSVKGCGEPGNKCRIDRLTTVVAGDERRFLWGGNCSLYDSGTGKRKLPDLAPDPFRERQALIDAVIAETAGRPRGRPTVALTDEFVLKNLLPFAATYLDALGFDLRVKTNAGQRLLKRGIEESNVAYCAPFQLYAGLVSEMAEEKPDFLLLPMLRDLPRVGEEPTSTTCPLAQASPDLFRTNLGDLGRTRILRPVIDMGRGNLDSDLFRESCRNLAEMLGAAPDAWRPAYQWARAAQERFQLECTAVGRRALAFCKEHEVVPVVVLGRAYTIYNTVLNSNVPNLLREQGVVGIPVDCYPVDPRTPVFEDIFWGYSQVNLRAAHQIRRTPSHYSLFCSNYSCGPDSFNLHFYAHIMEGKPFAIIETDGHSGDAGTKTRIEAFLYCVDADRRAGHASAARPRNVFRAIETDKSTLAEVKRRDELLLIPRMGEGAEMMAAALRAEGFRAECLAIPDRETVRIGRKHTSGKECVPMTITLGSVLQRVQHGDPDERYAFFMPTADGPCRFGVYNLLHKIVFGKLGLHDRIRVVSQPDYDYFEGISRAFAVKLWAGFVAGDLLGEMLHDVRPVEKVPGAARAIRDRYWNAVRDMMEVAPAPPIGGALAQVPANLFGIKPLLESAAREFAAVRDEAREVPTVAVVGEIYVRCDPFANDFTIDRLESRGLRVKFAPFSEWLEYSDWLNYRKIDQGRSIHPAGWWSSRISTVVQTTVQDRLYAAVQRILGWPDRTRVTDSVEAAAPYVGAELYGEAVLTVGGPVHEHAQGRIVGVVNIGPLECMPSKIAEAQFFHIAEERGLVPLTLAVNGDPVGPEILDNFAYEVKTRWERTRHEKPARRSDRPSLIPPPLEDLVRAGARALSSVPGLPFSRSR